ncbi:MAG TPA: valine--tRNA ligase, partial [Actinobacteria bacterium]|nr:valine--tRNA ligase [Actinomycetes bacterium]HEX21110.1 valine--tRNA ligase [Actinomycetota bacterium]
MSKEELAKAYQPGTAESKWYSFWQEQKFFTPTVTADKEPFAIVIPPPNVTGSLHMGHALNNTIQDVIIRRKRMQGYSALWLPGTDHAGIATQNKVEQQ